MNRRNLLTFAAGALTLKAGAAARAQSRPKMYRIGRLSAGSGDAQEERFKRRLAELGYLENRDCILESGALRGRIDSVPELAAALVRSQPDVIVAAGAEAVLKAVTEATRSTPIVFIAVDYDPVALGYVAGLPRPGGNITGLFLRQVEVTAKRVELLKEMLPSLTELGVFADAFTSESSEQMRAVEGEAARLGLRLAPLVLGAAPYDFAAAVKAVRARGASAILVLMSPGLYFEREQLVQAILAKGLPASFGVREFTALGGLMSYGANITDMHSRAADYVAKILKGDKPADLPVQQSTTFELVINLKTAKALGLTVPQSLLARADEVIE